ncbi:hypothetical protein HAX54_039606 [Datura stramonium]|uniref:RING-type E3 ubiquitin transferase n=1 Tax=Datura stramonium TaxID=4076 RepID=A0ABS8VLJ0_DATST|nr:hypothetical protein [Datura stramonium]
MGNMGSSGVNGRRRSSSRRSHPPPPPPPQQPQPEINANRIEPDEANPGKYLVAFTFDATVPGSMTVILFAKEGEDCCLTPTKESLLPPVTFEFQKGLACSLGNHQELALIFQCLKRQNCPKMVRQMCIHLQKAWRHH